MADTDPLEGFDFGKSLAHLSADEKTILRYHLRRRDAQTCPDPRPFIWFLMGGRGSGKTWTAANWIFEYARQLALTLPQTEEHDKIRVALVGQSFSDVQKTMCEGQSGLLSIIPKELQIKWNRSSSELWVRIPSAMNSYGEPREIYFAGFTSQVPEKLRGPQFHIAWLDEPAKLEDSNAEPMARDTTWSNLMFGLRLGHEVNAPHVIVSGTPTDCKLVQYLYNHEQSHITHMTTLENRDNLPETTIREILALNPSSRTYRQEVLAEILLDNPDALFEQASIEENRAAPPTNEELAEDNRPPLRKILGWDPSVSTSEDGDEAGIILTGYTEEVKIKARGHRGGRPTITKDLEAYVLKDLSGHLSPYDQAVLIIDTMLEEKIQDLVFERNQGADQIITILTQVLKEKTADFTIRKLKGKTKTVNLYGSVDRYLIICHLLDGTIHRFTANSIHALKNKKVRAETASIKYDQGKVHHPLANPLPVCDKESCKQSLEIQMTSWNPNIASNRYISPDRLDALVYTILLIFGSGTTKDKKFLTSPTASQTGNNPTPNQNPNVLRSDQQIGKSYKKKGPTGIYSTDVVNTTAQGGLLESGRMSPEDMNRLW